MNAGHSRPLHYAAVLIAAHLQHPAATDGMTLPDRVPFPMPTAAAADPAQPADPADAADSAESAA